MKYLICLFCCCSHFINAEDSSLEEELSSLLCIETRVLSHEEQKNTPVRALDMCLGDLYPILQAEDEESKTQGKPRKCTDQFLLSQKRESN